MGDYHENEAACCGECGDPCELIRPGKWQPTCECHLKCPCGGVLTWHFADPRYPRLDGWFCEVCSPPQARNV